jgi:hypothetical protein
MQYEVEVRVRTISASGHAVQEARMAEVYEFGDSPRWEQAGAVSALRQTTARLVAKLHREARGHERPGVDERDVELSPESGTPRRKG